MTYHNTYYMLSYNYLSLHDVKLALVSVAPVGQQFLKKSETVKGHFIMGGFTFVLCGD